MEKVSVIIPIYNSANTIERCIESVLNQTYTYLEIICIDDGSTDNSYAILEYIAEKEDRIILKHKKNNGVSSARNMGLKLATGKYILFTDIDDYMENDMIECLVSTIEKDSSDLVICNYKVKEYDNVKNNNFYGKTTSISKYQFLKSFYNYAKNILTNQPWNKLFVRGKITKYFDEDINLGEDLIFNINYIRNIDKISILNETKYIYDISNENSLTKKYKHSIEEFLYLYYELYENLYYNNHLKTSAKLDFWLMKNFVYLINNKYDRNIIDDTKFKYINSQYKYIKEFKQNLKLTYRFDKLEKSIIFSKLIYQVYVALYVTLK